MSRNLYWRKPTWSWKLRYKYLVLSSIVNIYFPQAASIAIFKCFQVDIHQCFYHKPVISRQTSFPTGCNAKAFETSVCAMFYNNLTQKFEKFAVRIYLLAQSVLLHPDIDRIIKLIFDWLWIF